MTVYEVRADLAFQHVDTANRDMLYVSKDYLRFNCKAQGESWRPPELYVPEPLLPRGDFMGLQGSEPIMVRDRVYQQFLIGVLDSCCELLPLDFEDERWWAINVLRCVNALNRAESVLPGDPLIPGKYRPNRQVFFDYRLPECPLFKIPETMVNQVLMAHGKIHDDYDLKIICERHGLTGLKFVELWRSE